MEVLFAGVGLVLLITGILGQAVKGAGWDIPAPATPLGRALTGGLGAALILVSLAMSGVLPPPDVPSPSPTAPGQAMVTPSPEASVAPTDPTPPPTDQPTDEPTAPPDPVTPTPPPIASGPWRGMPAEFNEGIDAAVTSDIGRMYLFKDDRYVRFDDLTSGMTAGPTVTAGNWHGMPADFARGIDAATLNMDNGAIYFFKGDSYIRFNDLTQPATAPVLTASNWRGMPTSFNSKIDAALTDEAGLIYFFRGSQYVRFTEIPQGMDSGYPKSNASRWTGMPESFDAGIDAALMSSTGVTYFFKGDEYVRFSAGQTSMDAGYPMKIGS